MGAPESTDSFLWNDLVPWPGGSSPISFYWGLHCPPVRVGDLALLARWPRLGPGWHRFLVKLGGMCLRRPSTQEVRTYLLSGGCHVTTGKCRSTALMDSRPCKLSQRWGPRRPSALGQTLGRKGWSPDTRPGPQAGDAHPGCSPPKCDRKSQQAGWVPNVTPGTGLVSRAEVLSQAAARRTQALPS